MIHSHKIKIALSALPKNDWWGSGIVAYPDNDMMVDSHKNQFETIALKIWNHAELGYQENQSSELLADALEKEEKFDFIFMRDHFLCNKNKTIVMCNMRLEERLDEGKFVIEKMQQSGYRVNYLPTQDCLAEGGEFFYLPKENILLAGLRRNNLKGAESMAELMEVDQLHIIQSDGYHLDTAICPIFNDEYDCIGINCAKEVFDNKNYSTLRDICKKHSWKLLDIENQDRKKSLIARSAMNCLTLPGLLLGTSPIKNTNIIDFTHQNNIQMHVSNVSQFNLSGGSVHCLTNELF